MHYQCCCVCALCLQPCVLAPHLSSIGSLIHFGMHLLRMLWAAALLLRLQLLLTMRRRVRFRLIALLTMAKVLACVTHKTSYLLGAHTRSVRCCFVVAGERLGTCLLLPLGMQFQASGWMVDLVCVFISWVYPGLSVNSCVQLCCSSLRERVLLNQV